MRERIYYEINEQSARSAHEMSRSGIIRKAA